MIRARISIGIDLGTTNCALAFVPLHGEARSEILGIPQWETLSGITESPALPSFLYLPDEAVAAQIQGREAGNEEWIVGRLARKKAGESPGRVVHSAKSWLCHHTSDRSARFLPLGSDDIAPNSKISPVRASALILDHLKGAWNTRFADAGADFEFDSQEITVTVPASFDAAAQGVCATGREAWRRAAAGIEIELVIKLKTAKTGLRGRPAWVTATIVLMGFSDPIIRVLFE
jgi:molecular chaperone DnaK (HSP70)